MSGPEPHQIAAGPSSAGGGASHFGHLGDPTSSPVASVLLHHILPHGREQGFTDAPINGASKAIMDAKIGGEQCLLGAPIGGGDTDLGILGVLAEAFKMGMNGPMTRGPMQELGNLTPIGPANQNSGFSLSA